MTMSNNNVSPLEINFEPTTKQDMLFEAFDDDSTYELLYGGSAGSAKSYGLCALIILKCLEFPGIRVGLARNHLSTLKSNTMTSFFEVSANFGLIPEEHYRYNQTTGNVKFYNGSEVILVELDYQPRDPLYTRLGGLLLTFGAIDEVNEIDEKAMHAFISRMDRWKNKEYGIKSICYMTCNPAKNWLYREFYQHSKNGTLPGHRKFIQALPTDNPYLSEGYIENLKRKPLQERERLLYGNWDYDDDPNSLMTYEDILNIWDFVPKQEDLDKGKKFITADIAFTSDKMVILVWSDYTIIDIIVNPEGKIEDKLAEIAAQYNVPQYQIAYDSDGVGKFLHNRVKNAKAIVNNSTPFKGENYQNLKTQLNFKLAEMVNSNFIKCKVDKYQKEMMEELQVIKHKPTDKVGKIQMLDKDGVKKLIGRSPDFSDAMSYRMYFEYKIANVRTFRI